MSTASVDTSSVSSTGGSSSIEELIDTENSKNIKPGPAEKQIEEYLKNFDLKGRIMKEKLSEGKAAPNEEEKVETHPSQEEIVIEDTTCRVLSPEEALYYQTCQNPYYMNQQMWQRPYEPGPQWHYGLPNAQFNATDFKSPNFGGKQFHADESHIFNMPKKSESLLQSPYYKNCSAQGDSALLLSPNLEKVSLTTQIIEMQKEDKISQLTESLEKMEKENKDLQIKLKDQEENLRVLGPRYKYMEENFEDFIKMKEEYKQLQKQKRKAEFKCTECYDKYVQTWSTAVMCESCVHTHEMLQNYITQIGADEALCVSRSEISDLEAKFQALKQSISERELDYENREEKAELIHLTALNVGYRTRIMGLETRHKQAMQWATALQKIIAKMYSPENADVLTYQEERWVERILSKYKKAELQSEEKTDGNISNKVKDINVTPAISE